ncbi:hypothetical protein AVEN_8383-1 [Araneus ventricosus]|uniref:Uncharacterized protein n=1 Tax=Araneus ventricosus TaxID=182803 RepID=A0A4Y2KHN4_ARAVE|nr:hypothetical protein AVEN_8383-1 [Araneus ventricosus]
MKGTAVDALGPHKLPVSVVRSKLVFSPLFRTSETSKFDLRKHKQSMLLSFSLVLSIVINNPAAENALSAPADVGGIVFKASPSFIIFAERFSVQSNN